MVVSAVERGKMALLAPEVQDRQRRRLVKLVIGLVILPTLSLFLSYKQTKDALATRDEFEEDSKNHYSSIAVVHRDRAPKDSNPDSISFEIFGFPATLKLPEQQLIVQGNETLEFWSGGMGKLCDLLGKLQELNSNHTKLLDQLLSDHHEAGINRGAIVHISEQLLRYPSSPRPTPLLNLTFQNSRIGRVGQGNYVTSIFCMRMAVARYGVALQWQCLDQEETRAHLLIPWFMGYYEAPTNMADYFAPAAVPTHEQACIGRYPFIRLDFMAKQIQQDTRRMAISLVGNRSKAAGSALTPSSSFSPTVQQYQQQQTQKPWYPDVELDDVLIHFRCGDVMGGARRHDFGMIQFTAYKQFISREAKSVGIITQPFDAKYTRGEDRGRVKTCQRASYLLVDYLHSFLGNDTRVTIHNHPVNETSPLAYARMVMANQSFCSLSSFGIFPVMGTFGHGYFQAGNRGVNPFNRNLDAIMPHLHTMWAPVMTTWNILKMLNEKGEDAMMNWFVNRSEDAGS